MKAYEVSPVNEYYAAVVFAETPGKARAAALSCDGFEDCEFVDIEVKRLPQADKLYNGQFELDWEKPEDRVFMVKECGFSCEIIETIFCKDCAAKEYCRAFNDDNEEYF